MQLLVTRSIRIHRSRILVLAPGDGRDWTQRERADIKKLGLAVRNLLGCSLVFGRSDAGDPWCAFFGPDEACILHLARIERKYVVADPQANRCVSSPTLAGAIALVSSLLDAA